MLAYQQQLAHHFASAAAGRRSPSPQNESRIKRSMSPPEAYQKEIDYVRAHMKRRSLSRSNSPVRSHSPTYQHHTSQEHHHFLIKRSLSEEDLRSSHERRRLSLEQSSTEYHHAITHRPQILMNLTYRHPKSEDQDGDSDSEKIEKSDEQDEDAPLDLSMGSKKRRGRADSGTDSDDSTGTGEEGRNEGRAYKKSLMKRYCKSLQFNFQINHKIAVKFS